MDFQKFGIDPRLSAAAESLRPNAFFHEKMLSHVVQKGENVCAKISLDEGREEACLLPALQWLAAKGPETLAPRVLVVVPDQAHADSYQTVASAFGGAIGAEVRLVRLEDAEAQGEGASDGALIGADVVIGSAEALLAAAKSDLLRLREFGFVIADSADRLAELPPELMRKLGGSLRPSWERRTLLSCSKLTVKAKNLAWDLADNPSEISIDGAVAKAQNVARESWRLTPESKLKFLLGLIPREDPPRLCVFCNLKDTAADVSKRLEANGIRADFILGALAMDRKLALMDRVRSGALKALVLTDQGAQGLPPGEFPLLVNYDIPLEPEYFVQRLEMLDRGSPGSKVVNLACDRYIFGLTAVEQFIGAKLDVVDPDPSLLAAEDKSEGMVFERRERSDRAEPEEREERAGRFDRRDRGRPSSRDGSTRDGRNPDIRRSIADATGGSLDMTEVPAAEPSAEAPKARENGRAREGRRGPPRAGGNPPPRGEGGRRRDGHPAARRDGNRRPADRAAPAGAGNPYDLPMEERMKRYREKYGRRLGDERSDESRGAPAPRSGKQRREGGPRSGEHSGQRPDGGASRRPREGGASPGGAREERARTTSASTPAAAPTGAKPPEAPRSVVDRVLGLFKKKPAD